MFWKLNEFSRSLLPFRAADVEGSLCLSASRRVPGAAVAAAVAADRPPPAAASVVVLVLVKVVVVVVVASLESRENEFPI